MTSPGDVRIDDARRPAARAPDANRFKLTLSVESVDGRDGDLQDLRDLARAEQARTAAGWFSRRVASREIVGRVHLMYLM